MKGKETRMCSKKRRFRDKQEAKRSMRNIKVYDGTQMRIYFCDFCTGYHLTSKKIGEYGNGKGKRVGKKR